jgi:hypothetical protein
LAARTGKPKGGDRSLDRVTDLANPACLVAYPLPVLSAPGLCIRGLPAPLGTKSAIGETAVVATVSTYTRLQRIEFAPALFPRAQLHGVGCAKSAPLGGGEGKDLVLLFFSAIYCLAPTGELVSVAWCVATTPRGALKNRLNCKPRVPSVTTAESSPAHAAATSSFFLSLKASLYSTTEHRDGVRIYLGRRRACGATLPRTSARRRQCGRGSLPCSV